MPLKYTTLEAVQKLEHAIAYQDRSIAKIKSIKRGDKDAIKNALDMLKDLSATLGISRDNCLANPNTSRVMRAVSWAAEQRGIDKAIQLFENPEAQLIFYRQQKQQYEKQLTEIKNLPKK